MTVTTVDSRINKAGGGGATVAPLASPPAGVLGARWIVSDLGNLARVFDGTNFIFEDPFWEVLRRNDMLPSVIEKAFFQDDVADAFDINNFSGAGGTINREKGYVEIDQGGSGTTGFHVYSGSAARTRTLFVANMMLGGTLDHRLALSNTVRTGASVHTDGYEFLIGAGANEIFLRRITGGGSVFTVLPNHSIGNIQPTAELGINVNMALFFDGDADVVKTVVQPDQMGIFYNETTGEVTFADMIDPHFKTASGGSGHFHYMANPLVWMHN